MRRSAHAPPPPLSHSHTHSCTHLPTHPSDQSTLIQRDLLFLSRPHKPTLTHTRHDRRTFPPTPLIDRPSDSDTQTATRRRSRLRRSAHAPPPPLSHSHTHSCTHLPTHPSDQSTLIQRDLLFLSRPHKPTLTHTRMIGAPSHPPL